MEMSLKHKNQDSVPQVLDRDSQSSLAHPSRTIVHAKLEMTEPGDHDEQEADAVANTIMSGGKIARKISGGGGGSSGIAVSQQMESQLSQLQGGGRQMPEGLRNMMESGFGQDFSQVRLHTDSEAANMSSSIHAKAFTLGNDIYFNRGQFSPNTTEGQRLVAHELTHTIQQNGKVSKAPAKVAPPVIEAKDNVPSNIRDIGVTTVDQEKKLIEKLLKCVVDNKTMSDLYEMQTITVKKEDSDRFSKLDKVIISCQELFKIAKSFQNDNTKKGLVQDLVQNVYNALSFVSVAMDVLGDDKQVIPQERQNPDRDDYGNARSFFSTPWSSLRDKFISVVSDLATLAHNPAIAVLIFEGTYYPEKYNKITSKSVRSAVGGDNGEKAPNSILQQTYGLVCNNVVFGSVVASGVDYDFELDAARYDTKTAAKKGLETADKVNLFKKRIGGLTKDGRLLWSEFKLVGNGEGEDALKGAKQGDILVFWNTKKDKKYKQDPIIEDAEANHIEIVAGVREDASNPNETMYLLSGAHGTATVNGWTREDGQLAWKNAKDIRNGRYMMRITTTNDDDRIPVNIPSIMQYQKYTPQTIGAYDIPYTNPVTKKKELYPVPKVMYLNSNSEISYNCLIKKGL